MAKATLRSSGRGTLHNRNRASLSLNKTAVMNIAKVLVASLAASIPLNGAFNVRRTRRSFQNPFGRSDDTLPQWAQELNDVKRLSKSKKNQNQKISWAFQDKYGGRPTKQVGDKQQRPETPKMQNDVSLFARRTKDQDMSWAEELNDVRRASEDKGGTDPVPPTPQEFTTLQVCLSPGCIADGAELTLRELQALAPPNVIVEAGSCSTMCGNGPVVVQPGEKKTIRHRRVKGRKVMELLLQDSGEGPPAALVEGYELVLEADKVFANKDYAKALEMYEKAIGMAFLPALDLQAARDRLQPTGGTTRTRKPDGLVWLIRTRRNEAIARLELGDVDGAMLAAQASCNLSRNTSAESFQVLAEIYRRRNDNVGELQALQTMFSLPVDEDKLPFAAQNQRRELGFRLAKLEREVPSQ